MRYRFKVACWACLLMVYTAGAQDNGYPRNYFRFPVHPGALNTLAGVLGDLRSNHFHGGIDIRTRQVVGLPVTAAAEGYVSRVTVQRGGYGNVIYLQHPNGMTTVYGHLQKFTGALGRYVLERQYRDQTFEIDLMPQEGEFPVKKGDLIALSGNTGSSQGPHLHFEIRDARDNFLNPLFFGFPEIKDNIPPRFVSIALAPMELGARVNGTFERQVFRPQLRTGERVLTLKDTVRATGTLGLELQAFDRMNGASFNYGLFCIEVKVDGKEVFTYNMEKFPSSIARDYNHLINYRVRVEDGERYYKCYNPLGHGFDLYRTDEYRGMLRIADAAIHQVEVRIYDAFDNFSELRFVIKGEASVQDSAAGRNAGPFGLYAATDREFVKVKAVHYNVPSPEALFYMNGKQASVPVSYKDGVSKVFLWDLKTGLPDSVKVDNTIIPFYYRAKIAPGADTTFEAEQCRIRFEGGSLFDTLYLAVRHQGKALTLNEAVEPLKGKISVSYKPEIAPEMRDRTQIYRLYKGREHFVGGVWADGEVSFQTRELGTFYPMADTVPPKARFAECSPSGIRAYVSDELSGIASFRVMVNGEWVLMHYEYKQNYLWSEKLNGEVPFEGDVVLEVKDRAGNTTVINSRVTIPAGKGKKPAGTVKTTGTQKAGDAGKPVVPEKPDGSQ